ncbi:MAG: hypothetical protein EOP85_07080 [Verrucomicrobiaceae bacterium]|nr:MAG: hypothetical protein EOP85_07080 [Verrucomicrobiaceae bacterium]
MTDEPTENAGRLADSPAHTSEHAAPQGGTRQTMCREASHFLSCANEQIRKNPVPVVAGAAALGLAIGLLLAGRHETESRASMLADLPDQANDFLSNTLATLRGNLKFW